MPSPNWAVFKHCPATDAKHCSATPLPQVMDLVEAALEEDSDDE